MARKYIPRTIERVLKRVAREFPAIVLTGPRQSGKTTTLKHLFEKKARYVSLEPPDVHAAAKADPRGFLEMYSPPVIFDEVQYAPELLPYVKENIDAHRDRPGQYFITGSQNLLLMERVTESLAGRAAILRLLALSWREMAMQPQATFFWESKRNKSSGKSIGQKELWKRFLRGCFPELIADPRREHEIWHTSYMQTYLERDVRSIRQVGDLTQFQNFLRNLAARSGGLLNLADLSRDLGIAVNTAKAWLSVLEASYQVIILRPYFANIGKRLVKTPKVYFTDVGMLCHLTGLKDPEHAAAGPMGGVIMETAVLSELIKGHMHRGIEPRIYFWRTAAGVEVDFIIESNGKLIPIEVKLSATPKPAMAGGIRAFKKDLGKKAERGYVVHPGKTMLPLGGDVIALPFTEL